MMLINTLLFALGIAAIAVPLWVHLRLGRVKKRAVVSSLHLMLAARQTSRSPRRIVNWPLLLLRCLLLLLLALGFGRLLIPLLGGSGARAYAVFVVDVSGSMQAEDAGELRWTQARTALQTAVKALDPASQVALVTSPSDGTQPRWESPSDALARAARLEPGYAANRLAPDMREAVRLLAQMPDDNPKILHLVSDFQRSALSGVDQIALPSNIELRIDKVGPLQARNRGITVSVLAAGATDIGLYAFTDGTSGEITLLENGEPETFAIAPGQVASRLADGGLRETWTERGLLLEDDDAIAADNVAYDAFLPQEPIPVWLYEPLGAINPNAPPRGQGQGSASARHIYEQATYYISTALQPLFEEEDQSESRFRPQILTATGLPTAVAALDDPGAPRILFIPATATIPSSLPDLAENVIARGGAVLFLAGPELVPAAYHDAFAQILPVVIGADERIAFTPAMAPVSARHPLWGGLDAQTRRHFAHVSLRQRYAVELVGGARALAYYTDAMPLIAERAVGAGRAYFVNTSADRQWSDWPADPSLFVPFVHLLAARALGFETFAPAHQPLLAGERATLKIDPAHAGRMVRFNGQQRVVDESGWVQDVRFDEPGIHDLATDDGTLIRRIAVNFPPTESVLDCYSETVALQRLESFRQPGGGSVVRWETEPDEGGIAWKVCMALAALLLLVEPVMANARIKS